MTTIYDIKKRAQQLSEKTDSETISPQEVGGLFSDLADYANDVDVNGSSLGIRKTYTSVSAMEADKNPVGDDGKPLKKGQLVNIYNQDDPSSADNNKVFSWQNPGWQIRTTLDAGYATREELTELDNEKVGNKSISNSLYDKNNNQVLPYNIDRVNGIYIQGRGGYGYEATYAVTDFIVIDGVDKIKWNGYLPVAAVDVSALSFYDEKKNFLSSISVGNTGTYTEEKREIEVNVPENAFFCRGCTFKNDFFSIEIKTGNIEYLLYQNLKLKNELSTLNKGSLKLTEELNSLISSIFKFEVYLTKEELEYNLSLFAIGWTNNRFYIQIGKDGVWYKDVVWDFSEAPTGIQNLVYYSDTFIVNALIDTSVFNTLKTLRLPINPFNIDSIPYYLNPNIKNVKSINDKLDQIGKYISFPTIISYEYSPNAPQSVHFNIHFDKETEITIIAESDTSVSKGIAGNVFFDDGSKVYPSINVSNGYGFIILKYNKPGTLKDFGFLYKPEETFTIKYTIQLRESSSIFNSLPSISYADNRIYSSDDNPLKIIKETIGFTAILHSIGYIGDSLMSGEIAYLSSGGEAVYKDCYEFSWGQRLSALIRGVATNFSSGGLKVVDWLHAYVDSKSTGHSNDEVERKFIDTKFQAYINGLGTNDVNQSSLIGTIDDIDFEDYNNNADTFYGNYAKILQKAREVSPKCFLFCLTIPTIWQGAAETNGYNDAIRNIAAKLDKCYIIDLYKYLPSHSYITTNYMNRGHMNTQGYQWIAYAIGTYIDYIITNNPQDFSRAALFGTEKENDMW